MTGVKVHSVWARVAARDGDALRVMLPDADAAEALAEARRVALLYERGGIRYQARAQPDSDGLTLRLVAPPRRRDGRLFPRATLALRFVATPARSLTPAPGIARVPVGEPCEQRVTLSASGMLAALPFSLCDGSPVDLLLELEDGQPPLAVQAEVVGQRPGGGTALSFTHPGPHAQERLADLIQDHYLSTLT